MPTIVDDHPGAALIHCGTNDILNDAFNHINKHILVYEKLQSTRSQQCIYFNYVREEKSSTQKKSYVKLTMLNESSEKRIAFI